MVDVKTLKARSTLKHTAVLSDSELYKKMGKIKTSIPGLNIILSADSEGGFIPGAIMFAGPSKHFKTLFALICCKAYLDQYPDSAMILFDSEFGSPLAYFDMIGIDKDRVLHVPFLDIEQLKFEMIHQIDALQEGEKVIFCLDSLGNAASIKEVEDAQNEKSVADMTRAKALKSLSRMVRMRLIVKQIPLIIVNHTYKEIGLYPKTIVGGGTGAYYIGDDIFIIGRQKEKEGTETSGFNFTLKVEKSRTVREGSEMNVSVSFEDGIDKWSGLLELAVESKILIKKNEGNKGTAYYLGETRYKEKDMGESFWQCIIDDPKFKTFVKEKYLLADTQLLEHTND